MVVDIAIDTKPKTGNDLAWRVDSVCREHPTQLWFAAGSRDIATAKSLCGACAVQSACLDYALSRPELLGIWAATTPSERAVLRRAARTEPDAFTPAPRAEADEDASETVTTSEAPVDVDAPTPVPEDRAPSADHTPPAENDPGGAHAATAPDATAPDATAPDELLTPAEAARRLGVTPNTVTRWSRAGKISAIQTIGGHRRYRTSDIERVLRHLGPLQ